MMVLPRELYNHILSFRPPHDVAMMIKNIKMGYEVDWIDFPSHQHLVVTIGGGTRMKQYYDYDLCHKVVSFSEYYFAIISGDRVIFPGETS